MKGQRRAFTIMETIAAFALVGVVLVLVAKVGFTSMNERTRSLAKQTAIEHLQNVLENARSLPWEKLTHEWASSVKLPDDWNHLLPEGKLEVKVETEKDAALVKRVTATLGWKNIEGKPVAVTLVGLFAARVVESKKK